MTSKNMRMVFLKSKPSENKLHTANYGIASHMFVNKQVKMSEAVVSYVYVITEPGAFFYI